MAAPRAPVSAWAATVIGMPRTSANICGQDGAAGAAAGERRTVEADAGATQHIDVAAVLEGHALEEGPQEMPLAVPAGDAVEAGAHEGALAGAVEERMEIGVVGGRGDGGDLAVARAERVVSVAAALDELADVPLEVGGGGGARLDRHEPIRGEARDA